MHNPINIIPGANFSLTNALIEKTHRWHQHSNAGSLAARVVILSCSSLTQIIDTLAHFALAFSTLLVNKGNWAVRKTCFSYHLKDSLKHLTGIIITPVLGVFSPKSISEKKTLTSSSPRTPASPNIQNEKPNSKSTWLETLFYNQSIFFAADNKALAEAKEKNSHLSKVQKIALGAKEGAICAFSGLLLCNILNQLLNIVPDNIQSTLDSIQATSAPKRFSQDLFEGSFAGVYEELYYRAFIQNCAAKTQEAAVYLSPEWLKNNKVFKWITSPSGRIITINTIFALHHLQNAGGYLSLKHTTIQVLNIFLRPTFSILHETSGNVIAPITAHVVNNGIVACVSHII